MLKAKAETNNTWRYVTLSQNCLYKPDFDEFCYDWLYSLKF